MKHVTTSDKSLLIGDEAAETLIAYATLLGRQQSADDITLSAYGADGDPVEATFVLNSGATLLMETSESEVPEPDNRAAVEDMKERMRLIEEPPSVQPMDAPPASSQWDE